MIKKIIICILLLIPAVAFALPDQELLDRGLEVAYPNIPGLTHPPTKITSPLPVFLRYAFELTIAASGFILFGSMVASGIQMSISGDNPGQMSSARGRLFKSFFGAFLILTSFIILNSIDPRIVGSAPSLSTSMGVTFYESDDESCTVDWYDTERDEHRSLSTSTPDLVAELGFIPGSVKINGDPESVDVLIFNKVDYEMKSGTPIIPVIDTGVTCLPISSFIDEARSVKLQYRLAGVYMCNTPYDRIRGDYYCAQGKEQQIIRDVDILDTGFANNLQGLRLVTGKGAAYPQVESLEECNEKEPQCDREGGNLRYNKWCYCKDDVATTKIPNPVDGLDECNSLCSFMYADEAYIDHDCRCETTYYGVILHEGPAQTGGAVPITPNFDDPTLINESLKDLSSYTATYDLIDTSSASVILPSGRKFDELSGGVTFYKEPDYLGDLEDSFGPFPSRPEDCDDESGGCIIKGTFGEDGPFKDVPKAGRACGIGNNGISSMTIDGSYIVILFKGENFEGEAEVFEYNVDNMAKHRMGSCCIVNGRQDCAHSAIIIPIKSNR